MPQGAPSVKVSLNEGYLDVTPEGVNKEVHYLQSQNGNLFRSTSTEESEFASFLEDVPKDLPWCTEALSRSLRLG